MRDRDRKHIFLSWLDEHGAIPVKFARAYAAAPADQDDLHQEILLQLWVSVPAFRGSCRPSTWIYRVALNTAMAWKRGERRHVGKVTLAAVPELASTPDTADRDSQRADLLAKLYEAIRGLPDVDRSLVLLHLDGVSYREMAEILGISVNYVGVKLNRIKKQLAVAMEVPEDAI